MQILLSEQEYKELKDKESYYGESYNNLKNELLNAYCITCKKDEKNNNYEVIDVQLDVEKLSDIIINHCTYPFDEQGALKKYIDEKGIGGVGIITYKY